jgi:hypothetical protein
MAPSLKFMEIDRQHYQSPLWDVKKAGSLVKSWVDLHALNSDATLSTKLESATIQDPFGCSYICQQVNYSDVIPVFIL